jgi:hypothetical protein
MIDRKIPNHPVVPTLNSAIAVEDNKVDDVANNSTGSESDDHLRDPDGSLDIRDLLLDETD